MAGRYFEDYAPGMVIRHSLGRTITEMDNVLFSALTMNTQPLHINEDYAQKHSAFGRRIVNGIFTLGLAVGISVPELTEGTEDSDPDVQHLQPGAVPEPWRDLFIQRGG